MLKIVKGLPHASIVILVCIQRDKNQVSDAGHESAKKLLLDAFCAVKHGHGTCEIQLLMIDTDKVANAITHVAAETKSDMIVVGTRGRGMLKSLVMGSVAQHLVTHSGSAVLVTKHTEATPSEKFFSIDRIKGHPEIQLQSSYFGSFSQ